MLHRRFTRAVARVARLRPSFTAAATDGARTSQRHFEWNDGPARCIAARQPDFGLQRATFFRPAEKRVALPFDERRDGREVDGNLVGKALVVHAHGADRVPDGGQRLLI
jgi:hypothetical protein